MQGMQQADGSDDSFCDVVEDVMHEGGAGTAEHGNDSDDIYADGDEVPVLILLPILCCNAHWLSS